MSRLQCSEAAYDWLANAPAERAALLMAMGFEADDDSDEAEQALADLYDDFNESEWRGVPTVAYATPRKPATSKATAAHYNRLSKMTRAERDEEILRAAFGPHFAKVFPPIAPPNLAEDDDERNDYAERRAGEAERIAEGDR